MTNYCGMCGAKREQADKFCFRCGARLEETEVVGEESRERLTKELICRAMDAKKHSAGSFIGDAILLILAIVIGTYANPLLYFSVIIGILSVINKIWENIDYRKKQYYILERSCVKKEYNDEEDVYNLRFENRERDKWVAVNVDKELYDATEIGEEFYVVFVGFAETACLCYKKKHWTFQG